MSEQKPAPADDMFPLIYSELKRVARRYLGRERRNHTLQPTALVNEAWLRLENQHGAEWQGRTHGLAIAAQAMRRLLVDHGRHQKRQKRAAARRRWRSTIWSRRQRPTRCRSKIC
jgi:RNA polymerase sigma factor (TIGR02999 family)